MLNSLRLLGVALAVGLAAPVSAREAIKFPERLNHPEIQGIVADVGPAYVAGQPSEAALRDLVTRAEVTTVINVRTRQEMDSRGQVPFDEAAVLAELGAAYFHIPLGGPDNPYTPEALTAFSRAMDGAKGKVLLHCTVGARTSSLWAAFLIWHERFDPAEAIRHASAINLPPEFDSDTPVNRLLGLSPAQP